MEKKPIIGITMGDPSGNGSEISVKALSDPAVYERCKPIIIGDANCMKNAVEFLGKGNEIRIHAVENVKDAVFQHGTIDVYDMKLVDMKKHIYGKVSKMCGEAAFQYVVKVIELAMKNEIDATVTNAICKEAINMAGHHYSDIQRFTQIIHTGKYTMMLAHGDLRVVHVSTHVSLRQACERVKERVLECIRIANDACKAIRIKEPKIGVAGLNPHCRENGMFGTEEIEEIQPAIDAALEEGIHIRRRSRRLGFHFL
ncbi:MAG: PdxA family protein [Dialister invisus]